MQERASIVPTKVLYHSRRDDAHHRVYVHRFEEAILVTDNHQVDRNFIQEESFMQLQRSRMQYIHLGVLQVRIQILHRQHEGTMTLIVFRDNRWQGDQVLLFNRTNLPVYISQQQKIAQLILEKIAIPEVYEVPHLSYTERRTKGFGSTEDQHTLAQNQASTSQSPRYFTTQDIFSLLLPRETTAVLVQDDSCPNNFEKAHAVDTSPGASAPRSMETTQNYKDTDNSYLDYIQYLSQLSTKTKPLWDTYPDSDSEWTNPFASEGDGRKETFIELIPENCE
ncbi:hypothetical protein ZIOFF_062487 [Zingiber officinale]|uniref:dUTPase-like domain-containing protein n=1 Tax=Zingiber officinale TaxID=94328 RepID=A0A8J5K9B9_ZINOF|nr:hypothetical protein ZIOFF_062487 [Zingiber officinale]